MNRLRWSLEKRGRALAAASPSLLLCTLVLATGCRGCEERALRRGPLPLPIHAPVAPGLNGMQLNGTPLGHLALQALGDKALQDPQLASWLVNAPTLIKYLVECALPADKVLTASTAGGQTLTFKGAMGLAPQWASGPCDEACQEWVSACLLARSNQFGVPVVIYAAADHPAIKSTDDPLIRRRHTVQEGAFYGNMFLEPPRSYACWGSGYDPLMMTFRVCTQPGNFCGIRAVGPCGEFDGLAGRPSTRHACETFDAGRGTYSRCHTRASRPGSAQFPKPDKTYARVITLWLKRTQLMDGPAEPGCKDPPSSGHRPVDAGLLPDFAAPAGSRCSSDDQCNSSTLFCDPRPPSGFCSGPCKNNLDQQQEQKQCGGAGSTCLTRGDPAQGGSSLCTSACKPTAKTEAEGACPPYQVCTGYALFNAVADAPGCYPFCTRDSECPPKVFCNTRVGWCGPAVDMSLRADGEPCEWQDKDGMPLYQCRGGCYAVKADDRRGTCGSLINVAVTKSCPDHPDRIKPYRPSQNDNLGICIYKTCKTDADCTAPLKCIFSFGLAEWVCYYPDL